jgi:hypothetical protein
MIFEGIVYLFQENHVYSQLKRAKYSNYFSYFQQPPSLEEFIKTYIFLLKY